MKWLKKAFAWLTKPSLVIGRPEDPYLLRWHLIPRNRFIGVHLHKFLRDDEDRALHDHPWWFISFLFKGRYDEIISDDGTKAIYRNAPSIVFRAAEHRHRVVLPIIITDIEFKHDENGIGEIASTTETRQPAWTLVITGPRVREWGFWCPKGFVPWDKFLAKGDYGGNTGRGCGE